MHIRDRRISVAFKLTAAAVAFIGLYLSTGLNRGAFDPGKFRYFTILSNAFCLAVFLWGAFRPEAESGGMRLKGAVVMAITTTMLIYWLVLAKAHFTATDRPEPLANLLVHLIVPLLMIGDWALFDAKGRIRAADPLWWTLAPFGYFVFTVIAAQLGARYTEGGSYPYFFVDPTVLGWGRTLINVALTAAALVALGYGYYMLDRGLGRMAAKAEARQHVR